MKKCIIFAVFLLPVWNVLSVNKAERLAIVDSVNTVTGEITVKAPDAGTKIKMGDILFVAADGKAVLMKATFPMMTLAKCTIEPAGRPYLSRIKKFNQVYKYYKGIEQDLAQKDAPDSGDAKTRDDLWNRITGKTHKPVKENIPLDIYSLHGISPSGDYYYLYRHRTKQNFTNMYDVVFYDKASGIMKTIADAGSDNYYLYFTDSNCYMTRSVENYKSHRFLLFSRDKKMDAPDLVFGTFKLVRDKPFYSFDGVIKYHNTDGVLTELLNIPGSYIYCSMASVNGFILHEYPDDDNRNGKKEYGDFSSYTYMEYDADKKITYKRHLFKDKKTEKNSYIMEYRYPLVLYARQIDTNDDGIADYNDTKNFILSTINVKTGEIKKVLPASFDLNGLSVHPSGLVFFGDYVVKDAEVDLFVFNPENGNLKVFLELKGGYFGRWQMTPDWKHLTYKKVIDTNGDKKTYDWEDKSEIYSIKLY